MYLRKIVTFAFVLAIPALIMGLAGCERAAQMVPDDTTTMPEMMEGEIPIGVIVAQTGVHAEPYGLPMQRGFELAREEINAMSPANITFIIEDDQSSVHGTVSAVQSLVDQGLSVFVGTAISTQLKAAYPIAQANGVVGFSSVSSASGLSSLGDYIFRAALAADTLVPRGVAVSQAALGYTKVAAIYDAEDVYSTSVNEEAVKALEAHAVEVVTVETVATGDTDFTTQLTSIMEANPDAIFVSALIPEMKAIMAQARTLGIPASVPFICAELDGPAVAELGDAAEGSISLLSWHSTSDTPGNQTFLESYQAKYGTEAEPWAAQSYATLYILANALANAQSTDAAAIRDALAQTMDFPTILGNFSFDPNGEAIYDPVVLQVKDGQLHPLEAVMSDAETTQMDEMSQPMATEIPIGMAVALTGPFAEPYGLPMQRGFELAREEINMLSDANLTFVTVDAQSTVEGGVAAVQQLVDQGVPALVGIGISTHLEQAFPIAQDAGIVAFSSISSAAGLSSIGDYIFRAGIATNILMPGGVMATQQKFGYTKVATIYDAADTYSTSSNEEITKALEAGGVEILTEETFQTGDTDFSAQLTSILGMEPEALFISALSPEMTQIIIQGRAIGIPDTAHFIVPDLTNAEIQKAGDAAEGAIAFSGWSSVSNAPGNQAFVQNYQAKYGIEPETWAAQSYATLYILANAIANAGSADSAAIRDALAQTMNFPTILGNFSFDPNGEAMYDAVVLIAKDGALQVFE